MDKLLEMDWAARRELGNAMVVKADDWESDAGKSLEVYGKLNKEGEVYILERQKSKRVAAKILRAVAKDLMSAE